MHVLSRCRVERTEQTAGNSRLIACTAVSQTDRQAELNRRASVYGVPARSNHGQGASCPPQNTSHHEALSVRQSVGRSAANSRRSLACSSHLFASSSSIVPSTKALLSAAAIVRRYGTSARGRDVTAWHLINQSINQSTSESV